MNLELLRDVVDETIPSATLFYRCGDMRFGVYMDTHHFFDPPVTRFWLIYGIPVETQPGHEGYATIDHKMAVDHVQCHPTEAMEILGQIRDDPQSWLTRLVL